MNGTPLEAEGVRYALERGGREGATSHAWRGICGYALILGARWRRVGRIVVTNAKATEERA